MGCPVDDKLLKMEQLTQEEFQREFAAVSEAVTSLQDQQQSLEDKVEEEKQRLDELSAQHSEQGENYSRILEIMECLQTQLGQGRYTMLREFLLFNLVTSLPRERKRVVYSMNVVTSEKGINVLFRFTKLTRFCSTFGGLLLAFTHYNSLSAIILLSLFSLLLVQQTKQKFIGTAHTVFQELHVRVKWFIKYGGIL